MSTPPLSHILFVGIDVGSQSHSVAFGDEHGNILLEFDMHHTHEGFEHFFSLLEHYAQIHHATPRIAMEGYNGWARPFDQMILQRGYHLFSVNNVKLARFKEMFPGAAKNDRIDAQKILELFTLDKRLPAAKNVLHPVYAQDEVNRQLKRLSRRYNQLVKERIVISNRMKADLQSIAPELAALPKHMNSRWFLKFLTLRPDIRMLPSVRSRTIGEIPYIRADAQERIRYWQKHARFGEEAEYVVPMIREDALRILELEDKLSALRKQMDALIDQSQMATLIQTIPGFATVHAATLAGEIGSLERFESEASLALYIGTTTLDNSSGKHQGTKRSMATNRRAKAAITDGAALNARHVEESNIYLNKKISEGKKHQQAVRSLARHLTRILWNMLTHGREYETREKVQNG